MPSNIEIKARARDFAAQMEIARRLADHPPSVIDQLDTFFHVPTGRLKLREFGDGTGELIQYHRADLEGPKQSDYIRSPMTDPESLKQALRRSLGVRAVVAKRREVFLTGQTRIHFDRVEGLGDFIELEVVLHPGQDPKEGETIAERLVAELGIETTGLIRSAYVDLLEQQSARQ